jgi:cytoskeletal protein CcmA (bactofilin family)
VIDGEIECDSADIEGTLNSTITVNGMLELRPTAILNGEIRVSKISVDPGAQLNGNIDMGGTVKSIVTGSNKSDTIVEKTA